jgi:hypothetical protein
MQRKNVIFEFNAATGEDGISFRAKNAFGVAGDSLERTAEVAARRPQ